MKKFILIMFALILIPTQTALAVQFKSSHFTVSLTNPNEISTISHESESWLTVDYKNGRHLTYHYVLPNDPLAKYYYLPKDMDETSNDFLNTWENNVRTLGTNGQTLYTETLPDKNGIIYIKRLNDRQIFCEALYALDGKIYSVNLSDPKATTESLKDDLRKLINTIYPR